MQLDLGGMLAALEKQQQQQHASHAKPSSRPVVFSGGHLSPQQGLRTAPQRPLCPRSIRTEQSLLLGDMVQKSRGYSPHRRKQTQMSREGVSASQDNMLRVLSQIYLNMIYKD